jgi:uncharacterized protein DUF6984
MAPSMSVESRPLETGAWRKLRKEEVDLIAAMVLNSPEAKKILRSLPRRLVKEMKDGGMGSLRFKDVDNGERSFSKKMAEAEFADEDGIPVSVVVNIDNNGDLLELDLWKVNFSPLKRYPRPEELRIRAPAS